MFIYNINHIFISLFRFLCEISIFTVKCYIRWINIKIIENQNSILEQKVEERTHVLQIQLVNYALRLAEESDYYQEVQKMVSEENYANNAEQIIRKIKNRKQVSMLVKNAYELFLLLQEKGIQLRLDHEQNLKCQAPKGVMTEALLLLLKEYKAELIRMVKNHAISD